MELEDQRLFSNTITLLEKVLDFRSRRHNLITANIANMDTPNYQATDLAFEDELHKVLESGEKRVIETHPRHFPVSTRNLRDVRPRTTFSQSLVVSNDLNTVDVEKEMGKLVENHLMYNMAAQIIKKKFEGIRNVIREGGR